MNSLPPMPALRTFEAAARHATFTAASEELHVTQSAVSHQIRFLEAFWGVTLFERGRPQKLAVAGRALAPIVRQFLVSLDATLTDLRTQRDRVRLRVSLTQSFASRWLLPRLPRFEQRHPEVQLWIDEGTDRPIDFGPGDADAAVRLSSGQHAGLHAAPLFREYVFPVASPKLLAELGVPADPVDLLRCPLLFRSGSETIPRWEHWFERAGVTAALPAASTCYPNTSLTIEAALAGYGIALVRSAHVEAELRDQRLIRLLNVRCPSPLTYHFVCPQGRERLPAIASFRDWMLAEARDAQLVYNAAV